MFSGLIQHQGHIQSVNGAQIRVRCPRFAIKNGDSIAVNGICLTVVRKTGKGSKQEIVFDLSEETRKRTTASHLKPGALVNIEPALTMKDALGGHIVQGHVDGTGRVKRVRREDQGATMWIETPDTFHRWLVEKGSVTVDGISLTVSGLQGRLFSVSLIPYTLAHTNLHERKKGDRVNLEADILAKYVARYARNL